MKSTFLFLTVLLYSSTTLYAQSITGFWEFKEVTVGSKNMTPVAKWTKIYKDGTYQSGNRWTQNPIGTYIYDKQRTVLL